MKKIFILAPLLIGAQALAWSVDHTGLQNVHSLEVNANTVRVEIHRLNGMRVLSTGERRNRQGELNRITVRLVGLSERFRSDWSMPDSIFNRTKNSDGGSGYTDIDIYDFLELYWGELLDENGDRLIREPQWINARRGGRISISVEARELDCSGQWVCGRGNTGTVTYAMSIPPLPSNLPDTCGPSNTLAGRVLDGQFQFIGGLDFVRTQEGEPIIEPSINEIDAFMCFLPVLAE
jgi:hypothetical protein